MHIMVVQMTIPGKKKKKKKKYPWKLPIRMGVRQDAANGQASAPKGWGALVSQLVLVEDTGDAGDAGDAGCSRGTEWVPQGSPAAALSV